MSLNWGVRKCIIDIFYLNKLNILAILMEYTLTNTHSFVAEAYGLPFLPAYKTLTKGQDVTKGVNFAFAGSTALNYNNYLNKSRILVPASNYSLGVQLKMFKEFRNSTCKSKKGITISPYLINVSFKMFCF